MRKQLRPICLQFSVLLFIFFMLSENLNAQEIISLDGIWQFAYRCEHTADAPELPERKDFTAFIKVPAYWDDCYDLLRNSNLWTEFKRHKNSEPVDFSKTEKEKQGYRTKPLPYIEGVGYYRKKVFFPVEWKDKSLTLQIGGAGQEAWIWLNGKYVGYHFGHSTKFEFPLNQDALFNVENELIIAVSNLAGYDGGFMLSGYKGRSAGLYRSVQIKVTGRTNFNDIYIYPDELLGEASINAVLTGLRNNSGYRIDWRIIDPDTNTEIMQGTESVNSDSISWKAGISDLVKWSPRNPKLYSAVFELFDNNRRLDSVKVRFGLRRVIRNGIDLLLNGNPLYLRGVTDHCYFPLTCTPPQDKNSYIDMIKKLKAVGFNWIRFHTWIPSEEYMDAADETGMLLMVEAPGGYGVEQWIEIFQACRNHPSVILYSGGNEQLLDELKIEWLAGIARLQKKFVPDALFNPQEALRGVEYYWRLSDLGEDTSRTPFLHNPNRLEKLQDFSDVFGQYGWGHLSYFAERGDSKVLDKQMEIYDRPCLSHEIGIKGNYINLDHESRMDYTRIGTDRFKSVRLLLEESDLIKNASRYYNNSCRWLSSVRKEILERVRLSKYYRGYDFLGGHDHNHIGGGYEAGVLNEFFELKPGDSVDDLLKINGETVLLLDDNKKQALSKGDSFNSDLFISHWGNKDVENGIIDWVLIDNNKVLAKNSFPVGKIPAGSLNKTGNINFTVPELDKAIQAKLVINMNSENYSVSNDWSFWLFPGRTRTEISAVADSVLKSLSVSSGVVRLYNPMNGVRFISRIDSGDVDFISNGGTVVLFGNSGLPNHTLDYNLGLAGRTHGNLATVVYNHPITDNFPHEGWCDKQFKQLFTDASTVVFNKLDIRFEPIIEVVSNYKYIIKQSCLFEIEVEAGRLIVCTLNFNADDPASVHLLDNIVKYAGNENLYRTAVKISGKTLNQLIKKHTSNSNKEHDNDTINENKRGNLRENNKS